MHKSKTKWLCVDCKDNTSKMKEHYFIRTALWNEAGMGEAGMLCVGCLEDRIGRNLVSSDFTGAHINDPKRNAMSDRLRSRILEKV
jgi:hypothetical protein